MNVMQQVKISKITLNFGSGKDQGRLEKGMTVMKRLVGRDPVKTVSYKRIPGWGVRPGLAIGCKCTLRNDPALKVLGTLIKAKDNILKLSNFDDNGNVSFGIHEYIDIPGMEYDPKIGVLGMQVSITLEKPGTRIKKRRLLKKKLPRKQYVSRQEAMAFLKEKYQVTVNE